MTTEIDTELAGPTGEQSKRRSSASIFGRSLILPFIHPVRLLLCGAIPCALLIVLAFYFPGWSIIGGANYYGGVKVHYPLSIEEQRALLPFVVWSASFILLAFWLSAWQRAVLHDFAEPVGRWLRESIVRAPATVIAVLLWLSAGLGTFTFPLVLLGYGRAAIGLQPDDNIRIDAELMLIIQLMMIFPTFWVFGRLAPLPALVGRHGWRNGPLAAWRASRGRGFGAALGLLAIFWTAVFVGSEFAGELGDAVAPGTSWLPHAIGICNLVLTALVLIWSLTIGALMAGPDLRKDAEAAVFD